MNPQKEKMLERITDTLGDDVQSHKEFSMLKLAKVLVEMEERISKKVNVSPLGASSGYIPCHLDIDGAGPSNGTGLHTSKESDPYLTALDDVALKCFAHNPLSTFSEHIEGVLNDLRKNHKGE